MESSSSHDHGYDEISQHPLERLERMKRSYKNVRQISFETWPHDAAIRPDELINDGFYYMGMSDKVQCVYCGGVLSGWGKHHNVHQGHGRHFRRCTSLDDHDIEIYDDVPFTDASDSYNNVADSYDVLKHGEPVNNGYQFGKLNVKHDIVKPERKTIQVFNSNYSVYSERLESFKNWSSDHPLKPEELASARLYYIGLKLLLYVYINRKGEIENTKG